MRDGTTVTDEKTRKPEVKEMDALRLTSAMPSAVAAARDARRRGARTTRSTPPTRRASRRPS